MYINNSLIKNYSKYKNLEANFFYYTDDWSNSTDGESEYGERVEIGYRSTNQTEKAQNLDIISNMDDIRYKILSEILLNL